MRTGKTKDFRVDDPLWPQAYYYCSAIRHVCFGFDALPSVYMQVACAGSTNLVLAYLRRKLGSKITLRARSAVKLHIRSALKVRQKTARSFLIWYAFVAL